MTEFEGTASLMQAQGEAARDAAAQQRAAQVEADLARAQAEAARAQATAVQEQARSLEDQIREAVRAAEAAANQGAGAVSVEGGPNGIRKVITLPNGQKIIVDGTDVHFEGGDAGTTLNLRDAVPTGAVDIAQAGAAMIAICVVGLPIARAFARWLDRRGAAPKVSPEVMTRLSNIENAVETVAVEVERISEGQRFTTRLLNERAARDLHDPLAIGERR